nr:MAG: hypothetical protein DiTV3a_F4ORF13 [Diabrotica toursvirus 3a]
MNSLLNLSAITVYDHGLPQHELPVVLQNHVIGKCYHCDSYVINKKGIVKSKETLITCDKCKTEKLLKCNLCNSSTSKLYMNTCRNHRACYGCVNYNRNQCCLVCNSNYITSCKSCVNDCKWNINSHLKENYCIEHTVCQSCTININSCCSTCLSTCDNCPMCVYKCSKCLQNTCEYCILCCSMCDKKYTCEECNEDEENNILCDQCVTKYKCEICEKSSTLHTCSECSKVICTDCAIRCSSCEKKCICETCDITICNVCDDLGRFIEQHFSVLTQNF